MHKTPRSAAPATREARRAVRMVRSGYRSIQSALRPRSSATGESVDQVRVEPDARRRGQRVVSRGSFFLLRVSRRVLEVPLGSSGYDLVLVLRKPLQHGWDGWLPGLVHHLQRGQHLVLVPSRIVGAISYLLVKILYALARVEDAAKHSPTLVKSEVSGLIRGRVCTVVLVPILITNVQYHDGPERLIEVVLVE